MQGPPAPIVPTLTRMPRLPGTSQIGGLTIHPRTNAGASGVFRPLLPLPIAPTGAFENRLLFIAELFEADVL
jgi:hypothetical protein